MELLNPDEGRLKFLTICMRNGLVLDEPKMNKLQRFVELLLEWNTKVNLVSRSRTPNIWLAHVLHSIAPLFLLDIQPRLSVLDLGTGGGFPGIPLSIVRPDLRVTLLDSIKKKTAAVEDMKEQLELDNIVVVTGRAEDQAKKLAKTFDVVISRAVAPLVDLVKWSTPLVRNAQRAEGGQRAATSRLPLPIPCLVALKGGDLEKEIEAAKIKSKLTDVTAINLLFDGSEEIGLEEKKIVIVNLSRHPRNE